MFLMFVPWRGGNIFVGLEFIITHIEHIEAVKCMCNDKYEKDAAVHLKRSRDEMKRENDTCFLYFVNIGSVRWW